MICPRCGNEWDASKSPCTNCGLVIRLPNQSGSLRRTSSTPQRSASQPSSSLPPSSSGQWSREGTPSQPSQPSQSLKQPSGIWQPFARTSSDSYPAANSQSSGGLSSNSGQAFPPSPSRGMPSNSGTLSTSTQPPTSPFARRGQPDSLDSGSLSSSSSPDMQTPMSSFPRGVRPNGAFPQTPPPSSSGPLARGRQPNREFPSFSSPSATSAPTSSQRNATPERTRPQTSTTGMTGMSGGIGQSQEQEYQRPFFFAASAVPETPQPFASFSPPTSNDNNEFNAPLPRADRSAEQMPTQQKPVRTDNVSPRSVPQRPQTSAIRSTESLNPDMQKQQAFQTSLRASRLVTETPTKNVPLNSVAQTQSPQQSATFASAAAATSQAGAHSANVEVQTLEPGTLLRGGRYRLYEMQGRQEWLSGVYEARWVAQDAQRGGAPVAIRELVLPENSSVMMQATLRSATMALSQVGRHPHIPTLWDAFSDKGCNFFVFEPFDGESLLSRMRRTGRAMPEQDVIECCLQISEVLELLAQQSPPLVHGLISPECILSARNGSQYALTNFSLVLAGGATQFVSGIDRTHLSPYTAPEFMRGVVDGRSDLYALMATAYHAVTGSVPAGVSGSIPSAQRLNPNITPEFDAILSKGLRPVAGNRYQHPSELRHDLLALRSVSGSLVSGAGQRSLATEPPVSHTVQTQPPSPADVATQDAFKPVAQALQSIIPLDDEEDQKQLLPRPEALSPMPRVNVNLATALWLATIILGVIILITVNRGF
jgi:Protein tyrosine and serine/threonine kinase